MPYLDTLIVYSNLMDKTWLCDMLTVINQQKIVISAFKFNLS